MDYGLYTHIIILSNGNKNGRASLHAVTGDLTAQELPGVNKRPAGKVSAMKKNGGGASQGPRVHWHREEGGGAKKGGLQDTHTPRGGHSLLQKQLSWGKWRRQCCKDGIAGPVTIATKGSCSFQKAGSAPA